MAPAADGIQDVDDHDAGVQRRVAPRDVGIDFGAMLATGPIDVRYQIEYRDYREATTDARIKR